MNLFRIDSPADFRQIEPQKFGNLFWRKRSNRFGA